MDAVSLAGADVRGWALLSDAAPLPDAAGEVEALVAAHARLVFRLAYAVLRNHHDAEDAAQETFLRVLRYADRLPGVAHRRAWLARIAWRVALDRRRALLDVSLEDAAAAVRHLRAAGSSPERIAADRQMGVLLERLIGSLPRQLREPLVLSTIEEMTSAEAGAVLDIPEATVRTRTLRARQLLREKLASLLESRHGQ